MIKRNNYRTAIIIRRNFSLVARSSLKFTRCSLIVVKSRVARCKMCLLLVAEVAHCKKSLVTRCEIFSLLVAKCSHYSLLKITCYLLQNLLVTHYTANFHHYLLCKVTNKNKFQLNLVMGGKILSFCPLFFTTFLFFTKR